MVRFLEILKKITRELIFLALQIQILQQPKKTDLNAGKLGISKREVRKIFRKSLNESEKKGKYLIHSNPNSFVLDDKGLTSNPIGKKCSKFSIISFNLLIDNYYVKKLNSSFFKNNINVKRFFDSGIASSMSCLTSKEKEEGVVCIDIEVKLQK